MREERKKGRGLDGFVAWRYLLERRPTWNAVLLVLVFLLSWQACTFGFLHVVWPLCNADLLFEASVPRWLLVLLSGGASATVTAAVATATVAMVTGLRGDSGKFWPESLALLAAFYAVATLALWGAWQFAYPQPSSALDFEPSSTNRGTELLLVFQVVFVLPAFSFVSLPWRRRHEVASVSGRLESSSATSRVHRVRVRVLGVAIVVLLVPAVYGGRILCEASVHAWSARLGIAGGALVLLALVLGRIKRYRRRADLVIALGVGVVACAVVAQLFFEQSVLAQTALANSIWGPEYEPPPLFVIGFSLGAAVAVLMGILLVIRFFFTFYTTVSMGGVLIGAMALVIVLSVMSGFETDNRSNILGANAHIRVSLVEEPQFVDAGDRVARTIAKTPGVVGLSPYLETEVVIAARSRYQNVIVKGVDPSRIGLVTEIDENITEGPGLGALWPLSEEGEVVGPPARDAAPVVEGVDLPAPDVVDFSGGRASALPDDVGARSDERDDEAAGGRPIEQQDPDLEADQFDLDDEAPMVDPKIALLSGVLVGKHLKEQIQVFTGSKVKLISPLPQDTPLGPAPRMGPFRVAGVFYSGNYEYDWKSVYIDLRALQDFLDVGDEIAGYEVAVTDPEQTKPVVAHLRSALGGRYLVQDWREINKSLFAALMLEKIAMFLVLIIIILVASFSIVGTLIMVVIEKAREIAILKTLGASDRSVMSIFVIQGFIIGIVGTYVGVAVGVLACVLLIKFGLPIPAHVYYIDRLPVNIEISAVVAIAIAGVAISVIATIYPAFVAARLRPLKGLHYE